MKERSNFVRFGFPLLLLILCVPIVLPYFTPGYFPTHDGEWAVVRLTEMFRELRDLQIPPRWSNFLNFGYGYPLFNFAYPFPYYLGVVIHGMGMSFVDSIKMIFLLTVPLSALFMYFFLKSLWKNSLAGLVGAILYLYYPYRMVDLYVRGSIGESIAFALFPLIGFCLLKIFTDKKKYAWAVLGGLFLAVLILSHNIMAIHFSILLAFLFLGVIVTKRSNELLPLAIFFLTGIGISCYFWLPALFEKHHIILSKIPIADRNLYFVSLDQLFIPGWGYAPPTETNGFSYQLGIAQNILLTVFLGISLFFFKKKENMLRDKNLFALGLSLAILVLLFLLFSPSQVIWQSIPLLSEINYPWTLLLPIGFLVGIASGYVVTRGKAGMIVGIALSLLAIVTVLPYAKPSEFVNRGDGFYMTNDATTTSSSEYMPLWVKKNPITRSDKKVVITPRGEVSGFFQSSKDIAFSVSTDAPGIASIQTIYYPGWNFHVNGQPVMPSYNNTLGVMEVPIPSGKSQVYGKFRETSLRFFADLVSIVSIIGATSFLVYTIVLSRYSKKKRENKL